MGSNNWASSNNWSNTANKWGSSNNWTGNSNWSNSLNNWAGNYLGSNSWDSNGWSIWWGSSVRNILDNSISIVLVVNSLDTSVREVDSVASWGLVSISLFSLGKVCSRVVISNSVVIGIYWWLSKISISSSWLTISSDYWLGNKNTSWESSSNTKESSSNESLILKWK